MKCSRLKWRESEVADGDIVTLGADGYEVADHIPAEMTIYDYIDIDIKHYNVTCWSTK